MIVREHRTRCDICDTTTRPMPTAQLATAEAQFRGWRRWHRLDLCPRCHARKD